MAGRPPLRIGSHGRITRTEVQPGVWVARCRYRDTDGVTRVVERRTPATMRDQYGAVAERELVTALQGRRPPGAGDIAPTSIVAELLVRHVDAMDDGGEHSPKTIETYRATLRAVRPRFAGVRVTEATPGLLAEILRGIQRDHGDTRARQSKTLLNSVMTAAVLAGAIDTNPVLQLGRQKRRPVASSKGAPAIDRDGLVRAYKRVATSAYCRRTDLRDLVLVLMATGARISEVLGLCWSDVDLDARTVTFRARVLRVTGQGLIRREGLKNASDSRTVALPAFALSALEGRQATATGSWVFPSTTGSLRDPNNVAKQWRTARAMFGLDGVSSHSWRKTLATVIDDAGLSARVGADQLGHAKVSMTQDTYMARNRVHGEVADVIESAVIRRK